jgi:diguanylate cyclase (GGDEF)-like protein
MVRDAPMGRIEAGRRGPEVADRRTSADTLGGRDFALSFRNRLTLFFVSIVIVPMIVVALLGFRLISDSENGKADSRLAQGQQTALAFLREQLQRSTAALRVVTGDEKMAAALRSGNRTAIAARTRVLRKRAQIARIRITRDGRTVTDQGSRAALVPAQRRLVSRTGKELATVEVARTTVGYYVPEVARFTGLGVVVERDGRLIGTTLAGRGGPPSKPNGNAHLGSTDYRYATFRATGFGGADLRVAVLDDRAQRLAEVQSRRRVIVLILGIFLLVAFGFAVLVSRALSGQIGRFLAAAKRLGGGDFSQEVPTDGSDEFAALGVEFNSMSSQLESKIHELERERQRLRESIRRTGTAVASGLDRDALLDIGLTTAVDGVDAEGGRITLREQRGMALEQHAVAGDVGSFEEVIRNAERAALESLEPADSRANDKEALAFPLVDFDDDRRVLGLISVARSGRPFTEDEHELFKALAVQATVSLQNVDLHNVVQRQAVTDELTGLFNHRRFQEVVSNEIERAKRFDQPLGLVMLDIDNFKKVNDTYGHQQGDVVLREVSRVLRESTRDIDEPARYGGEELAVALPQTDLDGAHLLAERVRESIEALEVPLVDGQGVLRVTASFGVAAVPFSAETKSDLIGAADAALYAAKHGGKNQTVRASATVAAE